MRGSNRAAAARSPLTLSSTLDRFCIDVRHISQLLGPALASSVPVVMVTCALTPPLPDESPFLAGSLVLPGARVPSAHMPGLGVAPPRQRASPLTDQAFYP
jgi:hypothetical protein